MAHTIRTHWITQRPLRTRQPVHRRNRLSGKTDCVPRLALAILLWSLSPVLRAADPAVEIGSQDGITAAESAPLPETEIRGQSLLPVLVSFGAQTGYDSNSGTTANGQGSWFTSQQVTLSYDRLRGPTTIEFVAGVAGVEYFSRQSEISAFLNLSATHEVSPRLSLSGTIDTAYRAEPDFISNLGTNRRNGNYITSADSISATYQWSERFSSVSNFAFNLIRYEDSFVASTTDREEYTFGEEFRFELDRQTVLIADYNLLLVNYDTSPRDSTTNSVLLGVEQAFTSRLTTQLRAGASFRSFEQGENQIAPDVEASVDYALARYSALSWNTRYGVEQPNEDQVLGRITFRTGLQLFYGFTPRISSAIGFYYHHDDNITGTTPDTNGLSSPTDAFIVSLSARYQFNPHWDFNAVFEHSEDSTVGTVAGYSRNHYSIGLNFTF